MIHSIAQFADSPVREDVRNYIQNYINNYTLVKIREDKDTAGLHHAMKVIDLAFAQIQKDYAPKKLKEQIDHSK